ncbi:hypothetical protein D3260_06355 [Salinisphaera sp. Q1T1-3]|nr:hypothetical protein D3260_06355 [Salinisphaera sp. Q1T1-3]
MTPHAVPDTFIFLIEMPRRESSAGDGRRCAEVDAHGFRTVWLVAAAYGKARRLVDGPWVFCTLAAYAAAA